MLHTPLEKFRYLLMRRKLDCDLTVEMQFHIETRVAELCGQGLPASDAVLQANREFGSVSRLKEDSRAAWEMMWLENLALQSDDKVVNLNFLIRTTGEPAASIEDINRVLGRLDRTASIETKPMKKALGLALLPSYAGAAITGSIGFLGALLAATGLYGLVLFTTGRRTREIGLRLALGATPRDVIRMVLVQSLVLTAVGVSIGLVIGWFATKPLATFLVPDLSPSDPASFAFVFLFLSLVSIPAALPPVLRASRIDPMWALRYE